MENIDDNNKLIELMLIELQQRNKERLCSKLYLQYETALQNSVSECVV